MRRFSLKVQIAFFALTGLAVVLFMWFCGLVVDAPRLAGIFAIVAAEVLIWRFGFWRTGVESALWLAGLMVIVRPQWGMSEIWLAAICAIVGARLRHPLFGAAAVVLFITSLDAQALMFGCVIGVAAALADALRPRLFFSFVTVAAPIAGYVSYRDERLGAQIGIASFLLALAIANLALGISLRVRAALIAGAVCIGMAAFEAHPLIPIAAEWKFILAGALLLAIATTLMRMLRARTTGITVIPVAAHELQEVAQAIAMRPMAAPDATPTEPAPVSGGGGFGGAGASGTF